MAGKPHNLDVKVRCTEEDRRKVEALAAHFDRNVSDTIRQLIRTAYTTMTHLAHVDRDPLGADARGDAP